MEKIILDTNFLLIPYQFKLDIFKEIDRILHFDYSLFILDKTLDELNNIVEKQKGKDKDAAKFALKLLEAKKIKKIMSNAENADDSIVDVASQEKVIVATQDKVLKQRLEEAGIPIIIMRQKKKLELIGYGYTV